MERGMTGVFHADDGDPLAVLITPEKATDEHGEAEDLIAVLADADDGSGLDVGWNVRLAKRGDKTGEWSPE